FDRSDPERVLEQMLVTAPFYSGWAYTVAAAFGRRRAPAADPVAIQVEIEVPIPPAREPDSVPATSHGTATLAPSPIPEGPVAPPEKTVYYNLVGDPVDSEED